MEVDECAHDGGGEHELLSVAAKSNTYEKEYYQWNLKLYFVKTLIKVNPKKLTKTTWTRNCLYGFLFELPEAKGRFAIFKWPYVPFSEGRYCTTL